MLFWEKIPAKEHYLLRLLTHLAESYQTKRPVSVAKISQRENISVKYLEKLIAPLKGASWLRVIRGREGGYLMVKNPKLVSLKAVSKLINRRPRLLICLEEGKTICRLADCCPSKEAWQSLISSWDRNLDRFKLAQLLK